MISWSSFVPGRRTVSLMPCLCQDDVLASKWAVRAAQSGDPGGCRMAAERAQRGLGMPRQDRKAHKWYTAAAEQGDVFSQVWVERFTSKVGMKAYFRKYGGTIRACKQWKSQEHPNPFDGVIACNLIFCCLMGAKEGHPGKVHNR